MRFLMADTEFDVDIEKIYNQLSETDKKHFKAIEFQEKCEKGLDWVKRIKYIIGPPYDKEMDHESPLMYASLFAYDRKSNNDIIQIGNFSVNANLFLNSIKDDRWDEFTGLIQQAYYSRTLKYIMNSEKNKKYEQIDKCVNFYYDEPLFENVVKLSMYYGYSGYKAQQWTIDEDGNITKGDKEKLQEEVFYAILGKAIDLLYQQDKGIENEIGTNSIDILKEYFLDSTEETVSSYELMNVAYENAITNGFIDTPEYDFDAGKFIRINKFEAKTYTKDFLLSKDMDEGLIGYQINENILIEYEKKMVYNKVSVKEFFNELLECMVNQCHKSKLITYVDLKKKTFPQTFNRISEYLQRYTFDYNDFCRDCMIDLTNIGYVAINPYTFYEDTIVIPDMNTMLLSFNYYKDIYMESTRDFVGIVSSTKIISKEEFIKKLKNVLREDFSVCNIKKEIYINDILNYKKNNCLDVAGYVKFLLN